MKTTLTLAAIAILAGCTATHMARPASRTEDSASQFLKHRDELINDYNNDDAIKLFAPDAKIALTFGYVTYPPYHVSADDFLQMFTSRSDEKRCGRKIFMNFRTTPIRVEPGSDGKTATVESSIEITSRTVLTKRILKQHLSETMQLDLADGEPVILSATMTVGRESIGPDDRTKSIFAKINSQAGLDEAEAIKLLEDAGFKHEAKRHDGGISIGPDSKSDALDQYGDEILALAAQIPDVRSLSIWFCGFGHVTDSGLVYLSRMESLQTLAVCSTEVTGEGIKNLADVPNLHSLSLCGTSITDEGCKSFSRLRNLKDLKIVGSKITDKGLSHISKLVNLESLALSNMQITDEGLVHIAKLINLEYLKLNMPTITDAELAHLEGLSNLKSLELGGTRATYRGVGRILQKNPGLKVRPASLSRPPNKTLETRDSSEQHRPAPET
jgi:hypothetical protein